MQGLCRYLPHFCAGLDQGLAVPGVASLLEPGLWSSMGRANRELGAPAKRRSGWLIPLAVFFVTACLSALVLAYAQLISMHTTVAFGQMAMLQQHLAQQAKPLPAASSLFPSDDGGTIRFN